MDAQNYKKLYQVYFDYCKILKIHEKKSLIHKKNYFCFIGKKMRKATINS